MIMEKGPWRIGFIVRLALFEATAIYGMVAAFLTYDWRLFAPTWILAVAGFIQSFPSEQRIRLTHHAQNQSGNPRFR